MNSQLSVGEWICQDFGRYLKSLETEGRCVFLPYSIQSLHLRNIGKFVEKHLDFGDVNVIHGNNGSGKTTIIRAIENVSGSQIKVKSGQNRGKIDMTLSNGALLHQEIFDAKNVRCIVLDDAGERLDRERYCEFLYYLRGLDLQLILTVGRANIQRLFNRTFPGCWFIDLN